MAERDYLLRTEASYFPWDCLTEQQRAAIEQTAGFLKHSSEILDTLQRDSKSELKDRRHSRLAFINADRGMGKTTVLVTLEKIVAHGDQSIGPIKGEEDYRHSKWLNDHRSLFKWLITLDLEPLPFNSNLLAAILTRISRTMIPSDSGSFLRQMDSRATIANEFSMLEQSLVQFWDGVSRQRLASLDPAYAATEVLTAESVALDFNKRLCRLLDEIAEAIDQPGAIFVVPIDDLDLTPTRCLELLRVIRMLSTPRLFFLIVGNVSNAEEMLRLQCEGELAGLAKAMATTKTADRIRSTAAEISSNHLRKLVPPHQRIALTLPRIDEALKFRLPGWTERQEAGRGTLESILGNIFLRVNYVPQASEQAKIRPRDRVSLLDQLLPDRSYTYAGSSWITGTPRQILDRAEYLLPFADGLERASSELETRRLLLAIADDARSCLLEDSGRFDSQAMEAIDNVVQEHPNGTQLLFREQFSIQVQQRRFHYPVSSDGPLPPMTRRVEWVVDYPNEIVWRAKDSRNFLDSRSAGALTFLHDLALSVQTTGVWTSSMLTDNPALLSPALTRWKVTGADIDIPWTLPQWRTFRELSRFWMYLRSSSRLSISRIDSSEYQPFLEPGEGVEQIAMNWIGAILAVLRSHDGSSARNRRAHLYEPELLVKEFVSLLREQAQYYSIERSRLLDDSLVSLLLMLTPEAGGFGTFVYELLQSEPNERFEHLRQAVRRRRRLRWVTALKSTSGDIERTRKEIDFLESSFDQHPFTMWFGSIRDMGEDD